MLASAGRAPQWAGTHIRVGLGLIDVRLGALAGKSAA